MNVIFGFLQNNGQKDIIPVPIKGLDIVLKGFFGIGLEPGLKILSNFRIIHPAIVYIVDITWADLPKVYPFPHKKRIKIVFSAHILTHNSIWP